MKMKFSVYIIPLISFCVTCCQSSSKVPGSSGCSYYGSETYYCQSTLVKVEELPPECTSFYYIGAFVSKSLKVAFRDEDPDASKYLLSLTESGKPTFLSYGHEDFQTTVDALSCNKNDGGYSMKTEIANLKTFLTKYSKLSGLIIDLINIWPSTKNTAGFSDNLKFYIDELKKNFPDFGIGISVIGWITLQLYEDSNPPEWLDFTKLDSSVDFYHLDAFDMNNCTGEFQIGGTSPVYGSAKYTIEKFVNKVAELGAPKEKMYIFFHDGPTPVNGSADLCLFTNQQVCADKNLDGLCADNTQSFYEKGSFTKQNVAGFIASDIDSDDDPYGQCDCGTPYPGFYAILAGFNGDSPPPCCPLLDKQ